LSLDMLDAVAAQLRAQIEEVEGVIRQLEAVGNQEASLAARLWKFKLVSISANVAELVTLLREGKTIAASVKACEVEKLAADILAGIESSPALFIAVRGKPAIAFLKSLAGDLCRGG